VALHEFAHALDSSGGVADGTPPLEPGDLAKWAYVLHRHYDRLLHLARAGTPSTLDHYGASNEAEFFAVATEAFFERPLRLRSEEQELYEALRAVYNQDPAALVLSSPLSAPTSRTADPAG
jgi:Mlc titration factor MtfA (ptsG expression regulator)